MPRDDDPPELRKRMLGNATVVAEAAMRLAWKVEKDLGELDNRVADIDKGLGFTNHQVRLVNARIDNLEGRIIASLGRIEIRLGTVEQKAPDPPITQPELPAGSSQRPISYHELPDAIAAVMPEVERRQNVAWWMGFIDGMKDAFRRGVKRGAASAVAALVVAAALLAAGYAIRDCTHAIVHQGQNPEIPKLKPLPE
jgi:hypothetical protein